MPKKFIKRYMPDPNKIRHHKHLQIFGSLLHNPNLWHMNRRSVSGAFGVGLFFAWVPVPFQMILAAAAAIPLRVNLPISVGLVWVTNPLTMPPMFYFAYVLGSWILGTPPGDFAFELSIEWLKQSLIHIWRPFLLGCAILGVISSVVGYSSIRLLWRLHLIRVYRKRKAKRINK